MKAAIPLFVKKTVIVENLQQIKKKSLGTHRKVSVGIIFMAFYM
jgi:hypothetical protein